MFGDLLKAAVNTVLVPLAVVDDASKAVQGTYDKRSKTSTEGQVDRVLENIDDAFDN